MTKLTADLLKSQIEVFGKMKTNREQAGGVPEVAANFDELVGGIVNCYKQALKDLETLSAPKKAEPKKAETKPVEEVKPVEEAKKAETKPVEEVKPVEEAKPEPKKAKPKAKKPAPAPAPAPVDDLGLGLDDTPANEPEQIGLDLEDLGL